MTVTHETILVALVRKDARIAELEAQLASTSASIAEVLRERDAARMEADNLRALVAAGDGKDRPHG